MNSVFWRRAQPRLVRAAAALAMLAIGLPAGAEVGEVRLARQFGIHYLPLVIMKNQNLIEQQAKENGLTGLKVSWTQLSGGASANDALLSGAIDFVAGGVGPLIVIWDKTKGGRGDVRGMAAVSDVPMTLLTRNPGVKSIKDFSEKDKIALPAIKTSMQAVTLQMAAAKEWGDANYEKLDKLTVSMKHPDATAAMLSGKGEVTAHFTAAPYDFQQLKDPSIRKVLDSFQVYGGPATLIVLYTTEKFRTENPKVYRTVLQAMEKSMQMIKADKRRAAQIYLDETKEKTTLEEMVAMLEDPQINFKIAPSATMPIADFMHRIGRLKNRPESWKDMFFPEIHDQPGS